MRCIEFASEKKFIMDLVKIIVRGQITIPLGRRRKLGVKDGDRPIVTAFHS